MNYEDTFTLTRVSAEGLPPEALPAYHQYMCDYAFAAAALADNIAADPETPKHHVSVYRLMSCALSNLVRLMYRFNLASEAVTALNVTAYGGSIRDLIEGTEEQLRALGQRYGVDVKKTRRDLRTCEPVLATVVPIHQPKEQKDEPNEKAPQ